MPESTRQQRAHMKRELVSQISDLRRRKWTLDQIAATTGKSRWTVSWICLTEHIDPPVAGWPLGASSNPDDSLLRELEAEGLSYTGIGRRLNRAPTSVRGRLATLARRDERAMGGVA